MVAFSGVFLSSCSELIPGLGMDASRRKAPSPSPAEHGPVPAL